MSDLTNNSAQTFKTPVTEKGVVPIVTLDANDFPEAVYRIFALDCTTVLVTATLTGGDIIVVADVDAAGAAHPHALAVHELVDAFPVSVDAAIQIDSRFDRLGPQHGAFRDFNFLVLFCEFNQWHRISWGWR